MGSVPITSEVTALTGITGEMVAGQRIDEAAVSAFVEDAVIVIAHNTGIDRKFAERYWPVFERKAWRDRGRVAPTGFEGSRLGYLLNGAGFFHQAHRGCRGLSCLAGDPRARITDDGHASTCRPVGAGPKEDDEDLGGTVAIRPESRSNQAQIGLNRSQRGKWGDNAFAHSKWSGSGYKTARLGGHGSDGRPRSW
jgi:hypothetical protein